MGFEGLPDLCFRPAFERAQTWTLKFNQEFYLGMQITSPAPSFMSFEIEVTDGCFFLWLVNLRSECLGWALVLQHRRGQKVHWYHCLPCRIFRTDLCRVAHALRYSSYLNSPEAFGPAVCTGAVTQAEQKPHPPQAAKHSRFGSLSGFSFSKLFGPSTTRQRQGSGIG